MFGKKDSTNFFPNSRFMNEFAVIIPTYPAASEPLACSASPKNLSVNGMVSEYWR